MLKNNRPEKDRLGQSSSIFSVVGKLLLCSLAIIAFAFGCGDDNPVDTPVVLGPAGKLYVLNQFDGTMYIYDTKTLKRTDSISTVVQRPHFIDFSPDGANFYITTLETSGHIAKFDAVTNQFIDSVSVSPSVQPSAMDITADSRFGWVSNFTVQGEVTFVYKYDLTTTPMSLVKSKLGGESVHDLTITADGSVVVVCSRFNDELTLIYTDADTVNIPIPLDPVNPLGTNKYGPFGVVIGSSDTLAYVACLEGLQVRVLNIPQKRIVDSIDVPVDTVGQLVAGPTLITVTPDERTVYVTTQGGNSVVACDMITKTTTVIPLATPKPFGITMSDDGSRVYVACVDNALGQGRVYVIDTKTNEIVTSIGVGKESFGLIWRP